MNNKIITDTELIKKEIARLHKRGSGDFQSLMRQVNSHHEKYRKITLNIPQMLSLQAKMSLNIDLFYDRWSRGGGKTTEIGAEFREASTQLQRGVGQFIAPSYKMFLTRVIPSLVAGLEMNGLYQGLHYFVGEKPPKSWVMGGFKLPYQPPKDFAKFISVFTGFGCHMISQDVAGDGRGLNTDIQFGDEDGMNDWAIIQENNTPALRGSKAKVFEGKPFFLKKLHHSSMPLTETGGWVFDFEEKNVKNAKEGLPPVICVIDADSSLNAQNLAKGYLQKAEQEAISPIIYNAEYKNIRPSGTGSDNFYPHFKEKWHGYRPEYNGFYQKLNQAEDCRGDSDLVRGVGLAIGGDYGSAINTLVVMQRLTGLQDEIRILKNFWAIGAEGKIQDDLYAEFDSYYRYHKASDNRIFYYYDNTGNVETGNTRETRAEQAAAQLRRLGWRVTLLTQGRRNPEYTRKFRLYEKIMSERDRRFPKLRINVLNCKELLISMSNAKIISKGNDNIEKDKSSEKRLLRQGKRQHATDLCDGMDAAIYGMYGDYMVYGDDLLPPTRTSHR